MSSGGFLNCGSSGQYSAPQSEKVVVTTMSSMPVVSSSKATLCSPCNVVEPFSVSDWESLSSVPQNVDFNGSRTLSSYDSGVIENQGVDCSPAYVVEQNPRLSCLNNDFRSSDEHGVEDDSKGKKKKRRMPEWGAFDSTSPVDRIQIFEAGQQKDVLSENVKGSVDMEERKHRAENNSGSSSRKLSKQFKENCEIEDAPKEECIHIRAKRGHATNSHSLAERVRREKISERMKLLQDLVPGCNKITGKAVMLDEIINYVQSLQRQVEFLSMKLSAVNPELSFDIEHILSNDIFQSRDLSSAAVGFGRGMSYSDSHMHGSTPRGVMQAEMVMCSLPSSGELFRSTSQIPPMAQISNAWDDEFQNVLQMGFARNTPLDTTELPGFHEVGALNTFRG